MDNLSGTINDMGFKLHVFFFIRTKFIRTQAFGHPEIKNMIRTQGFPQQ